jgi:hypothetical protein
MKGEKDEVGRKEGGNEARRVRSREGGGSPSEI